jgi:hypothetical protein
VDGAPDVRVIRPLTTVNVAQARFRGAAHFTERRKQVHDLIAGRAGLDDILLLFIYL